jgi:hypothetical protein
MASLKQDQDEQSALQEPTQWLKDLRDMRQKRKQQLFSSSDKNSITKQKRQLSQDISTSQQEESASILSSSISRFSQGSSAVREKIYDHYLKEWEKEHNKQFSDPNAPTQVLLSGQWKIKDQEVLMRCRDSVEKSQDLVFLEETGNVTHTDADTVEKKLTQDEAEAINCVAVTIVNPEHCLDSAKRLCVVDEKDLVNTLKKELKPYLKTLLENMLSTLLLNNYDIMLGCVQHELQQQLPDLLEETLNKQLNHYLHKKYS